MDTAYSTKIEALPRQIVLLAVDIPSVAEVIHEYGTTNMTELECMVRICMAVDHERMTLQKKLGKYVPPLYKGEVQ